MRTEAPALMPIFRSHHQGLLLSLLLTDPVREFTLTELATELAIPKQTAQSEVQRLVEAGILRDRRQGRNRLISANPEHPAIAPLTQLALIAFGPRVVIAEEFSTSPGAERVLIFGSWAARYAGQPGPPPADIDVLVIGDTTKMAIFDAADRAHRRLGIEVNPERCTPQQWADPDWALIKEIKTRPYLTVYEQQTL
ncbi:ArsR family transcriptional regulator [Mycolicibacterium sp. (ex Dasyatis americana)]|uniref:winged helix-turn-helix domain-containing protein n=1 Tax=Mycobacterium sp. DBP42 TaxID=2545267 RepID=UPI0008727F52|nr:winged helix-turn-helix domain-containing protein [Mycobacterium sp. DBP42]OFB42582.1 ArsR family transcriptional regulator [Mycolicibacterium sp. (ex Dasyatis americana)]TMS50397.1 winged helix-turn-helix transcriptional regulator [Mycobacterium sp. DBP42]